MHIFIDLKGIKVYKKSSYGYVTFMDILYRIITNIITNMLYYFKRRIAITEI